MFNLFKKKENKMKNNFGFIKNPNEGLTEYDFELLHYCIGKQLVFVETILHNENDYSVEIIEEYKKQKESIEKLLKTFDFNTIGNVKHIKLSW